MGSFLQIFDTIRQFLEQGGPVLLVVAIVTFFMWVLIFERLWFYRTGLSQLQSRSKKRWEKRPERQSWNAHQIRLKLVSEVNEKIYTNTAMIAALVTLCPLLGLMGTVTGMIEVFNVLAVTGGGDAKSMASGVSRATIPTMAGMVAALSGVFGTVLVNSIADRKAAFFKDSLTLDH